jgi:hypothetical protein
MPNKRMKLSPKEFNIKIFFAAYALGLKVGCSRLKNGMKN